MINLSEHNLDWARHMVRSFDDLGHGRDQSTARRQRRLVAEDTKQWLEGNDWDQNFINEKFKQHFD